MMTEPRGESERAMTRFLKSKRAYHRSIAPTVVGMTALHQMRFSLQALLVATGIVAFVIFAFRHCLGPVVPASTASQIQPGMTQDKVYDILGSPNDGMTDESWEYVRTFNPGWFVVYFDANGKVSYVDHGTAF